MGDKPYELYSYADRIWMDVPPARFFKGAPVLEVMDFLERLAPFTHPNMLVRDKKPMMTAQLAQTVVTEVGLESGSAVTSETTEGVKVKSQEAFDPLKALRESLGR